MNNKDDEIEIKIEYFDSFEEDPLRNINNRHRKTKDSGISNIHSEFKKQEEMSANTSRENDVLAVNYENYNEIEPENIINWYKEVDEFGKFVCRFCDLSYSTVQTLRHHVRMKHAHNYNNIKNTPINHRRLYKSKCHVCKKTFDNINGLQKHSNTHGLNTKQKSCLLCLVTFKEHNDLLNHMTNKHESLKKIHICTTCGYSTSKVSNFKKHLNVHTGENKKKCAYCPYTTNYEPNMKIHIQIHSNEKPYVCGLEACEYQCKTMSALRSHQVMHNKKKHMLHCDQCSYSTVYKINLKKHIDTHWRSKLSESNRNAAPNI